VAVHSERRQRTNTLTKIVSMVPAVGARTSTVTLSVSICTIGSSSSTGSPGCFRMAATAPSVMDSPKAGIFTWRLANAKAFKWKFRCDSTWPRAQLLPRVWG